MRTSSCKAKGRRACAEAAASILASFPVLQPDDVRATSSGATGEDLQLSPVARAVLPLAIECKNTESLNVWAAYAQAETHAVKRPGTKAALIYRRNRSKLMITLTLDDFLALYTQGVAARTVDARLDAPTLTTLVA